MVCRRPCWTSPQPKACPDCSNPLSNVPASCWMHPRGGLYLNDPAKEEVHCVVSYNTPSSYVGTVLKHGEGIAGKVAQNGQILNITNYQEWTGRSTAFDKERPFTAVIGIPLLWGGQVSGVIDLLHYDEGRSFDQADRELGKLVCRACCHRHREQPPAGSQPGW